MYKNNYEKIMAEMTPRNMALIMMCPYQFDAIQEDKCGDYEYKCVNCCEDYLMSEVKNDG